MAEEEQFTKLSKVARADMPTVGKGSRRKQPPAPAPLNLRKSLSANSSEILDEVYESLGGTEGSRMYWRNHEEQFRTLIESKFLTKQVLKDAAVAQGQEISKNIFMTFIQNNGLQKNEPLPQVEATIVNPELEEKE